MRAEIVGLLTDQIEFANVILLNKIDLLTEREKYQLLWILQNLNPLAKKYYTSYSNIDLDKVINTKLFKQSKIFLTQLEIPIEVTLHCLKASKNYGLLNILNPAPACKLTNDFFNLVDYFTPNETEAEFYTGIKNKG